MNVYSDVMKRYDIQNQYELYNLFRKAIGLEHLEGGI